MSVPRAGWTLAVLAVAGLVVAVSLPPIPQDPAYHRFADRRALLGIANFTDVATSLAFVLAGAFAALRLHDLPPPLPRAAWAVFAAGVALVGLGSAAYHLSPSNATLVWDRLPMAVAFAALFALVVADRVSPRLGARCLWPLVLAGAASVLYWQWTESVGRGDLRAYGLVQFLPAVAIPALLLADRGRGLRTPWLWAMVAGYALAKVAEQLDAAILAATGVVGGHALKHLLGALAAACAARSIPRLRRPA